jgi:hypothetical protein
VKLLAALAVVSLILAAIPVVAVIWIALGESDARDDAARDAGQPLDFPPSTP